MAKDLAAALELDLKKLLPVLAAAHGDLSVLSESYGYLTDKLQLSSINTLRYLTELAHGNTDCLYKLSEKRSQQFNISDPELFAAVFKITYIGKKIHNKEMSLSHSDMIESVENAIRTIWLKL